MNPLLLQETFDSLREGVQIVSPDWRYLYLNETAARHGRKPRAELLGKTMLESYPGIEASPMFAVLKRCLRDEQHAILENEFEYDGGDRAWFELRVQPCRAGLIILSVDITDRKRLEDQRAKSHREALRALLTPVIRVHEGILLVPLIGTIDSGRAEQMMESVLTRVVDDRARALIIDVAGVPDMDTHVAHHLVQTTAAVRLLGAETILTGISASTAKTIGRLGLDLSSMQTTSQLSQGIELALAVVGKVVAAKPA